MAAQALLDFITSTRLVYMVLMVRGLTGCGLLGYSLVSALLTGQSNIAACLFYETLLFLFKCFVCFVISVYYS